MKSKIIHLLLYPLLILGNSVLAQHITSEQLLEKTIAYHDPLTTWPTFRGTLFITTSNPNNSKRTSEVTLDFPAEYFKLIVSQDSIAFQEEWNKGICSLTVNGNTISKEDTDKTRPNCESTVMMKNYYTYLFGLPMKLRDKGVILDRAVHKKTFLGKEYLVLKVTYEESVGEETWYFYFDPISYALEVYQFYQEESKNDGEYVLLDGLVTVNGMKIPKKRSWFNNKDKKLLGTDLLTGFKELD
jgi:hypothetical protein